MNNEKRVRAPFFILHYSFFIIHFSFFIMETFKRNILITGGAGFIGSHVVRLFVNKYPEYRIINLDKLTYAGNLANLKDIENQPCS